MQPTDPRHGTYAGWHAHQKTNTPACAPCTKARRRYQKRIEVDHSRGIYRRIDPALARRHIERLYATGMGYKAIADAAGVAPRTIYRAAGLEPANSITRAATAAILAVPLDTPVTSGYRPAYGAIRRLRALVALGYPCGWLADELGMARSNMSTLIRTARPGRANTRVQAATWQAIDNLYQRLHMTPGPSDRARAMATGRGWVPPLAWDDVDDEQETPARVTEPAGRKAYLDHAAMERRYQGDRSVRLTAAEARAVIARCYRAGRSTGWIEQTLGMKPERHLSLEEWKAETEQEQVA